MSNNQSDPDNSRAINSNYTLNTFDSLLEDMNQSFDLNQTYLSIDKKNFTLENTYHKDYTVKKTFKCRPWLIFFRLYDFILFLLFLTSIFLFILGLILYIIEISFSFYSIILINYVFFMSSIISYGMAPIYKSLSQDWLNMTLSFAQVILASPLIAFYIFFILKSVISLVEFFTSIPSFVKNIISYILKSFKTSFQETCSIFFSNKNKLAFDCLYTFIVIVFLLLSSLFFGLFAGIAYGIFFFDKSIIALGSTHYILIVIQIFAFAFPTYAYFFQTLFGIKCKKFELIEIYIDWGGDCVKGMNKSEKSINEDTSSDQEEKEKKPKRIINDPLITELGKDDVESENKFTKIFSSILSLTIADDYFSIYYYSKQIALDRHKQSRKRICMLIFFILNMIVIAYDVYKLILDYSDYLLFSIIIRFVIVPFFSYYNIITVFYHKAKDKTLQIVNYVSIVFTVLIVIVVVFGAIYSKVYQNKFRINDLNYYPPFDNVTIANEQLISHPICSQNINNVSAFESFGYSLGGFDIKRDRKVFDNQMKIFFGENYKNHISYSIHDVDEHFFFIKFYDASIDTYIYAFRGYTSGPEIAFQFELFVSYYIIPFFDDIIPLYEIINDNWLSFYTNFFHSFGIRFFDNRNLIVKYANSIIDIYKKQNDDLKENVIFTGINCGGVIAKIVGTLMHRKSISFLSFPMGMDFLEHLFHYSSTFMSYVTNVFNIDGIFSHPDSDHTINIGIDMPVFYKTKFCTSGFCDLFSKTDNIYRTFCTMSETCGKGNQFKYYCEKTIGEKNLNIIRESLLESD